MLKAIETKQREDGSKGEQKLPGKSLTSRLIAVGFLVLPSFVFGECPGSIGVPGVGWIDLFSNDLAARIDRAFTPIFVCLLLVVCIIATFEIGRAGIQTGRNETRNPEHGAPAGRNHSHRRGIV